MKAELYNMLMSQAVSEKEKALLTLNLLSEHPAGIGDHSTEDFYKNANEALVMLVDANDKIVILEKYFPSLFLNSKVLIACKSVSPDLKNQPSFAKLL